MRRNPRFSLRPAAFGAWAVLHLMVGAQAQAQTAAAPQRVEVTGSSIKRLAGETALPVETIRREDIEKIGVTTAAELLQKLSSNVGGLTDGASISDQSGAQRGFNGANLRGLGVSSTAAAWPTSPALVTTPVSTSTTSRPGPSSAWRC